MQTHTQHALNNILHALISHDLNQTNCAAKKKKKNNSNTTLPLRCQEEKRKMKNQVEEKFAEFFEKWVCQLDDYSQQLIRISKESSSEAEQQDLVSKLTSHYKEYYTVKWALAHEDVLVFYCQVWVSTFEMAYSWVTGWKPSIIFRLVDSLRKTMVPGGGSLAELTEQQLRKIEELRLKIRLEEEKVEREMERQQVALADGKMVELARLTSRLSNGEVDGLVEVALKGLLSGLEKVMKAADCVRLKTLKGILDVLSTKQSVDFLAGTSILQIQMSIRGAKRVQAYVNTSN